MRPFDELEALTRAEASGEFIASSKTVEIHVYLQRGRVAWATTSTHPLEFVRALKARCQIEDSALRSVVEECRQRRLPLGETLVAWGVVSYDDVRAALHHQIARSTGALSELEGGRTVFLTRNHFTQYDTALTFTLDAFAARPHSPAAPSARSIRESIPGAVWVEVANQDTVDSAPPAARSSVPDELSCQLNGAVDFVAFRSPTVALLGVHPSGAAHRIWCATRPSSYGAAVSRLGLAPPTPVGSHSSSAPPPIATFVGGSLEARSLRELLERGNEARAVVVLDRRSEVVRAVGRTRAEFERCAIVAKERARMFDVDTYIFGAGPTEGGVRSRAALVGDNDVWLFGVELADFESTAWLLTSRKVPQALGWACSANLARSFERSPSQSGLREIPKGFVA
ncbi:MAG: hypothetical protein U0271_09445 [Polyangiaceae bacterium]